MRRRCASSFSWRSVLQVEILLMRIPECRCRYMIRARGEPMRTVKLLALVVAACSATKTASAQQPGDKVVTITNRELRTIRMMMGERESVPRGTIFYVQKVEGNRLWVSRLDKAPAA